MTLQDFPVRAAADLPAVLDKAVRAGVQGVFLSSGTLFQAGYREIADWCQKHRVASVGNREYAEAGGLIGYESDDRALYFRGAHFVARILGGAKVADLPVEQASRFELILNRGAARRIGLTLPDAMSLRADEIIDRERA
jgi:putative ABC transport system substrate-binding protein